MWRITYQAALSAVKGWQEETHHYLLSPSRATAVCHLNFPTLLSEACYVRDSGIDVLSWHQVDLSGRPALHNLRRAFFADYQSAVVGEVRLAVR